MKKICELAALLLFCVQMNAQNIVQNHYDDDISSLTEEEQVDELNSYRRGGLSYEYMGIEDGWGMNIRGNYGGVEFGLSLLSGDTNEYVSDNSQYRIDLGYTPRYWFNKHFFVEGTVAVGYYWSTVTLRNSSSTWHSSKYGGYYSTSYDTEEVKDNDFYLTLSPRVGVKLFKLWGSDCSLVAGYRWDFYKFKTKKENTLDYFTVGLTVLW